MHQPAHAVLARSLDEEIGCRHAWSSGLRPDARVARQQRAVGKRWPVAPDRGIEALRATRVHVVADALDPFDVGAEAGLAGQVERHVHAEAAGLGDRVDQARERRAARERVVIALRVELARRELARVAFDAFRHARGFQSRAVDEQPGLYLFVPRSQDDSVGNDFGFLQGTLQGEHRPARLGIAEVREHQRVAVDDSGRGRVERGDAVQLGLERERLLARHPHHVGDAIGVRLRLDFLQLRQLPFVAGDDQLAAAPVRDAVRDAVLVKQPFPCHAAGRLEAAFRVIDARVNDLGIARAGVRADRILGLQDDDFAARRGEGARRPDGSIATHKLLSENPGRYRDAALAGIRKILNLNAAQPIPAGAIDAVKMGTTVATNALLERKGERTVLFITRGFRDALRIAYQNRPRLFDRHIVLPEMLYSRVFEVEERIGAKGEVVVPLNPDRTFSDLKSAFGEGFRSIAIVFMHGYRFPQHESHVAELARKIGFTQISVSHRVSPLMKLVGRGDTTMVDAYLSPILRGYVDQVAAELEGVRLLFMQSNGGLTDARRFQGKDAILSGPAGGIVGAVRTSLAAGFDRIIGFDMGGTSTDVSHYAGEFEREFETRVAGVRMRAPMMSIHSVAAGGGSILHFDGARYRVGPDSAGANPGPACYRRGGPLTVTDANVMLGKIQPAFFPRVFGPSGDQPLDASVVQEKFRALTAEIRDGRGEEQIADGYVQIAVGNMANAIKHISVQRGHDVTRYTLNCFGGAAGQHACLVADALGMTRVFIHPHAGVLSAYGMGLADQTAMRERAVEMKLDGSSALGAVAEELATTARDELVLQGVPVERIRVERRAHLKYDGTDTALVVPLGSREQMVAAFEAAY